MLSKTHAAFKAAGASDLQAREAAEEIATHESRLVSIESDLKTIKRDLSEAKWLVRLLVGSLLVWLLRSFLAWPSNPIQPRTTPYPQTTQCRNTPGWSGLGYDGILVFRRVFSNCRNRARGKSGAEGRKERSEAFQGYFKKVLDMGEAV